MGSRMRECLPFTNLYCLAFYPSDVVLKKLKFTIFFKFCTPLSQQSSELPERARCTPGMGNQALIGARVNAFNCKSNARWAVTGEVTSEEISGCITHRKGKHHFRNFCFIIQVNRLHLYVAMCTVSNRMQENRRHL